MSYGGERLYYAGTAERLTTLKKQEDHTWLNEVASVPLQQSLRHLDSAFRNFFEGRAEYPTYHKKHGQQAATYVGTAFKWDGKHPVSIVDMYLTPYRLIFVSGLAPNVASSMTVISMPHVTFWPQGLRWLPVERL